MIKKILLCVILLCCVFTVHVSAEDNNFYKDEYELSHADELKNTLPDETRDYLDDNGIDMSDYNWVNSLSTENVFKHIFNFIKTGAKAPLRAGAAVIEIILITAALTTLGEKNNSMTTATYVSVLSTAAFIAVPIYSTVTAAAEAMKGSSVFMLTFIPIFAGITAASGKTVTSVSMSAILLAATQFVSYIANFIVVPLMGGYLAMSISSSVSPLISKSGIAEGIRKISIWILSLVSTIFVGILGIQTSVNSAADGLAVKTAKFILGSSVPIAGSALSEAFSTVTASMGLLKSSVGIYGVVACCALFLPLILEMLLWRAVLLISSSVSELFSLSKISSLLKAVDLMMSLLLGVILLTAALFIISLTIVVTAGKA